MLDTGVKGLFHSICCSVALKNTRMERVVSLEYFILQQFVVWKGSSMFWFNQKYILHSISAQLTVHPCVFSPAPIFHLELMFLIVGFLVSG